MSSCYMYVVARDFGFAPNPFHGICTLATCKPGIRRHASAGDWVVGMGGSRLKATGRCVFAMRISAALSFDEYWSGPEYRDKRPVRNGSQTMMVGDNVYHRDKATGEWLQEDSHHSNPDGTPNEHNVRHDTRTDRVLVSDHFYYFGRRAPIVPGHLLDEIGYQNGRNYRKFPCSEASHLITWLDTSFGHALNLVISDPFDFEGSAMRYSAHDNSLR